MISGCKITQLKLNLHPINRSFFHDGAKRAKIGYTHADARGADTDARRGHRPVPPAHLPSDPQDTHRLHSRLDRQRTLLLLLLHPEDVPHHPREPRSGDQIPHPAGPHPHGAAPRGRNTPPRQLRLPFALLDRHDVDRRRLAALPRHQIRRAARRRLRPSDGRHVAAARRAGPYALPRIGVVRRTAGLLAGQGEDVGGGSGHLAHRPFGAAQQPHRRIFAAPLPPRTPPRAGPHGRRFRLRPGYAGIRHRRRRG